MKNERTEELINEIKDISNVYSYISKYNTDFPNLTFSNFVDLVIQKKRLKKSQVVKNAGLHRTYGYQIISGKKKPSRDKALTIAYGLELSLEETQKLLNIAEFNPLYPKNKRDSIIIFTLCNHYNLEKTNLLLYDNKEEPIS
ncbi:MAG: transcriptional regulator [Firmicutes bacterium HGW-Firmicutes-1]|jgi:hypothetical protein|nr:MAG: transcriptional regulator [Firmicutes bacterium HGW-Firmicutes-1]